MISVIIPVYNAEKHLDRCVESIVNQTYANLEIILIEDGSPDRCPEMCDNWAKKDPRIRVIHQQNKGQGIARNCGLNIASGKWISFVDSDDFIDNNTYAVCLEQIEKQNADVCFFGMSNVSVNGTVSGGQPHFPNTISKTESRNILLPLCFGRFPTDQFQIGSACIGLYSRSYIEKHHIRFPNKKGLISEDFVFSADICRNSPTVTFVNERFYYYRTNPSSFTHRYESDRFERSVQFHENRLNEIERLNLDHETRIRAYMRYWTMILAAVKNDVNTNTLTFSQKLNRIQIIIQHPYTKECNNRAVRQHMNIKKQLFLFMLRIRSRLGVFFLVKLRERN